MTHAMTTISKQKVDIVLGCIMAVSEGPREAFGIIATVLKTINEQIVDPDQRIPTKDLCDELCISIESCRPASEINQ